MTTKIEAAAQQALGALEQAGYGASYAAIDLREALAEQDHFATSGKPMAEPDMNLNCKSVQARLATTWGYVKAEQDHFAGGGKAITFPNLQPVINWLDNGRDPKEAAKELRIYQEQMKVAPVSTPEQEPVAFALSHSLGLAFSSNYPMCKSKERAEELAHQHMGQVVVTPLYAAPVSAKREWVELTDDEIHATIDEPTEDLEVMMWRANYCRAVIAAFKEKNK